MPKPHVAYLLDRIDAVAALSRGPEPHKNSDERWNSEDLSDVTLEVSAFLRDALDVPAVDRELVAQSEIDTDTLAKVTEWFVAVEKESPRPFGMTFPDGTSFDWPGRVERLQKLLTGLSAATTLESIEVGLRLGLIGDAAFASMLMALNPDHELRTRLEAELLKKLELLKDEDALTFWARLRGEVDPSSYVPIDVDPSVAPNSFFDLGDAGHAREKVASYLARVRPLLVRKTFEKGKTSVPAGQAGIATVLSWKAVPSTRTWSVMDRVAIRALSRVAFWWSHTRGDRLGDLAEALGIEVGGYFVGGRGAHEAKRSLDSRGNTTPSSGRTLSELVKLVRIADQRSASQEGSVERALRAYKLGLEVMAQDLHAEFVEKDELRLQREMCRFLVERSIRAYGTKFGWSEVDVRADDGLGAVVIETKVLPDAPSEGDVNRWLTQLGSYLDQEHLALRAVLVLYNFSATAILCPVATIRARYLILAVNLCPESPSKRKASIEIEVTTEGSQLVRVHKFGGPERTAKKRTPR